MSFVDHTLYEALPYGFMVLGLVLTFRYLKVLDLTFAASFSLSTAVLARLLVEGHVWWVAIIASLGAAVVVTALTVGLVFVLRVDSLLAGLISSFAGYASALMLTRGSLAIPDSGNPLMAVKEVDRSFLWGTTPLHPSQILIFGILLGVLGFAMVLFLRSEAGLAFRLIEDDRSAGNVLSSIGLSKERISVAGLVIGNLLAATTGILIVLKEGQATAQRGFDAVLTAIAAYLLGITLFEARPKEPGQGQGKTTRMISRLQLFSPVTASLFGILLYFLVLKAVSYLDVPSSLPKLVLVALLVSAIMISRWPQLTSLLDTRRRDVTIFVRPQDPLRVKNVTVSYPGYPKTVTVLSSVSLEVHPGELVQIRGGNGTGKSTLLRYLAGEIPGRGTLEIPAFEVTASRREKTALIRQDATFGSPSVLTVCEFLSLVATGGAVSPLREGEGREIQDIAEAAVAAFQDTLVGHLSGGQRQVLNIAALLARPHPPVVVLFDEPLTHLDEENASKCVELIAALKEREHCLLVVQHDIPAGPGSGTMGIESSRIKFAGLVTRTVDIEELNRRSDESPYGSDVSGAAFA